MSASAATKPVSPAKAADLVAPPPLSELLARTGGPAEVASPGTHVPDPATEEPDLDTSPAPIVLSEPASQPEPSVATLRRGALRLSNVECCFATVHVTLTGANFLTGYAVMLGATDFQLGLMNSFPHFLQVFQVLAAYVTWHIGSRRTVCASGVLIWRGTALLLAVLPFVPGLSMSQRVAALLGVILVSNLAAMFTVNAWAVWMADLVPQKIRGRFFGYRSMLGLVVAVTAATGGAALLDACKKHDVQGEKLGFLLIFGLAAAAAITGLGFLRRQWEPPMRRDTPPTARQLFGILRDPDFRRLSAFFFVWNFGLGLSASFFAKHMIQHLHMDYRMMTLYSVIVSIAGFISARPIGRWMDRAGTARTLAFCATIVSVLPLIWLLAGPNNLTPLWVDGVLTGIFWTGFQLAALNLPWVVTPERNRAYFLGVFTTIAGLGIGLASILSGQLATLMSATTINVPFLPHPLINYHLIFILSAVIRVLSLMLVPRDRCSVPALKRGKLATA